MAPMSKKQDGIAVLISLRNDGQLPWLIESLESIFGKDSVKSLYTEKAVTITVGKSDFREMHRRKILEEIKRFDGIVLDELEIYDHHS